MNTRQIRQPSCFLGIFLIGLVCLGSAELVAAEQRRRTAPQGYIDPGRHRSSPVETVLPGNTNSWRPYTNPQVLVTLGMSKAEVLLKAGGPASEEVVSYGTDGHRNQTVWAYVQTGHNASVTTLTFQGNRLARIDIKLNP
jgi:Protein of unknown function (DUF2845)